MSTPSRRTNRSSTTPRRTPKPAQPPTSSPEHQLMSEASQASQSSRRSSRAGSQNQSTTPRGQPPARNAVPSSSPLRLSSSAKSARSGPANGEPSSPLRQRTNAPSDGDRTPRASRGGATRGGDSSPIRYAPSSTTGLNSDAQDPRSSSSALFVRSTLSDAPGSARQRRGDVHSDFWDSSQNRRRRLLVDGNGMPVPAGSDTATFSNINPGTSDAEALGGRDDMVVWGTNISLTDTAHAFGDFLRNFQRKYRMVKDGEIEDVTSIGTDHPGSTREYIDMMKAMLEFGVTTLNLDMRNLQSYPPTQKLWYQMQNFPEEIIPIVDTVIKDVMLDLAERKGRDILQQMLEYKDSKGQTMNVDEVEAESFAPIGAGSDTTSVAIRGAILYITTNPHIYIKLMNEISNYEETKGLSSPVSYKECQEMPYLNAVCREVLRLNSPVGTPFPRLVPAGGVTIAGQHLPAGTEVGINSWCIARSKAIYGEDADHFRPERWLESEDQTKYYEKCDISFGAGYTLCLGKNIAVMEMQKTVVELVRNFEITIANPEKPWVLKNMLAILIFDFYIFLKPREKKWSVQKI